MTFDDFYWSELNVKNSNTNLAERFGYEVWMHQQKKIDLLQSKVNELEYSLRNSLGCDSIDSIDRLVSRRNGFRTGYFGG